MKFQLTIFFAFILFSLNAQLDIAGTIIDQATQKPLSYVNIGVVGKNIGTVSDRNGNFILNAIPESHYSDTMRISIIGYESIEMEVNQLEKKLRTNSKIDLKSTNYEMQEVLISSSSLQSKKVGNLKWKDNISAAFGEDKLGNEMGIVIKIKKRRTIVKDVTFVLGKNDNEKVRFRLNIYEMKRRKPGKNLLKDNIILEATVKEGKVTTDLSAYNIVVEDDFLLSIEWIEDYPKDSLDFAASFFGKKIWIRETSQAKFIKIPIIGIGLSATILY